jgi:hypothetical protein
MKSTSVDSEATQLFTVDLFSQIDIVEFCPIGHFDYASEKFMRRALKTPMLLELAERMSEGIDKPRFTYRCKPLRAGETFGHGRWHVDGKGAPEEIHRLLTYGGTPTEGEGGVTLHAGTVWEYSGRYQHRARPAEKDCVRLLLRVSQTEMMYRDHWGIL